MLRVIKNYKIDTSSNYMKDSGLIDNMLQDMQAYTTQLRRLGLEILATRLKESNDKVRQLIAERNEERAEQVLGELAAARRACDEAYAVVVFYTNAYFAMNPDVREAEDLVKRMQEDLEYFRQHAMTDPNRSRDAKRDSDSSEPTDETVAAEPEEAL